jgi:hypothetical protein
MSAFYRVNFELANNEDLRQAFALSDDAQVPVDLTGAGLKMQIRSLGNETVLEASNVNGRIAVLDAPNGRFDVAVPAAVMQSVAAGSYQHDLVLSDAAGRVKRIWTGTLTLSRGVTQ